MNARRILIIDDDETFRLVLRESLSKKGYDIQEAANAKEARTRLTVPPDLIILDVMMPDVDGITLCREIRSDERTQSVPVVIVSALDDADTVKEALLFGATDFAVKPLDLSKFEKKIEVLLRS